MTDGPAVSEYVVEAADQVAERVRSIVLRPRDGQAPAWQAGAHVRVSLPSGEDRPYSLVNFAPTPGATDAPETLRLGVLLEEASRGGSAFMHGLAPGDSVRISSPANSFPLVASPHAPLLVAGGIGVTPIASMAAALVAAGADFRLCYFGRNASAMAFVPELEALCGARLHLHRDDVDGPPDLAGLMATHDPRADIYVCGPRGMIEATRAAVEAAGIAPERLHVELFAPEGAQEGDTAFEVEVSSTGQVFTIPPGRSIIEVLEEAGLDLMYDCQRGDCGICQTDVLSGTPDHRDVILTKAERDSGKVMQICVSRALSARLVLDL